tara:strand:+ start:369 stop:500 length:132 start_codon:yes stop_codon:yes gene_type:complete
MKAGEKTRCPKCDRNAIVREQADGNLYCNLCHYQLGKAKGSEE